MKNILFLHTSLNVGGAEMMRLVLLRNIDRKKYNIKICCLGEKGGVGKELESLGYRIDELKQNPDSLNPSITYKLIAYLRREKPDILHSSLFNANFHARIAGLLCRVPHLITEEHGEHAQYRGIKFFPYIFADFLLSRFTDCIICCSKKLQEDIIQKEKLPGAKVLFIENCLDISMYKITAQREMIRKKHNISDELVFITVATLKAGKGHDYLIEAFKEVKDAGYAFKCFFAGSGPLKDMLFKKCRELGLTKEIIFLGDISLIPDYLNASDIFVFPSLSEGLSIALMEAMLMGLPAIVTDVGANGELIKTGFNGTVIAPGNKGQLRDALIFYMNNKNLLKVFGERVTSIIKNRYSSIDRYVKNYYTIWDRCLDNND